MESWSVDQVCNWLRQRNLGELVPKFREEEVNGAALLALNDRMVQQLVKKIGHQAVLMDLINKYKHQKHGLQSFAYACEAGLPTLPEISGPVKLQHQCGFASNEIMRSFMYYYYCMLVQMFAFSDALVQLYLYICSSYKNVLCGFQVQYNSFTV